MHRISLKTVSYTHLDVYKRQADYEAARARQSFTSLDYAKTYDSNASYELKGADSDISTLDVKGCILSLIHI